MERVSDEKLTQILDAAEGRLPPPMHRPFEVDVSALFGSVSGAELEVEEFSLAPGLTLRKTFAHIMAPYLMAFSRPTEPSKPHPGPWRAVSGGLGFDVTIEIALQDGARPLPHADRLNTVWWALSLLRLVTNRLMVLPVLADMPFRDARDSVTEPKFWPMEISRPRTELMFQPPRPIETNDLSTVAALFGVRCRTASLRHVQSGLPDI